MAEERADGLKDQIVVDMHTNFLEMRRAIERLGWNNELGGEQTIEDLKFANYIKEMFLDSDTKIALISSAPSDIPRDWLLTNEQMTLAREKVNNKAAGSVGAKVGTKRLMSHIVFTPGQPGWLDKLDAALALKPDSVKGYTIGDNTHKELSRYPWRMDDEKVTYRA